MLRRKKISPCLWMSSLKQNPSANSRRHPAKRPSLEKKRRPIFWTVTGRVTREKQDWPWKVDPAVEWDTWVYTRDDETTHQFIDNPAASLSGYSQPNPFVPIYVKLKERRDSRVDRMIVYQPLPHLMAARETREFITKLNDSPVKDFR